MKALMWSVLVLAACDSRSVPADDGAVDDFVRVDGLLQDSRPRVDQAWLRDGPARDTVSCASPALAMGLVSTMFESRAAALERTVSGAVSYHSKVTTPLASSPLFDHEIQIDNYPGPGVVIQYYLPAGLSLPLTVSPSALYTFTMKRRLVNGSMTEGLIITANVPGPWPFVLIAEPATYGQAFDPGDSLISPLKVALMESTSCPGSTTPGCAPRYVDRLRFEATTGASLIAAELHPARDAARGGSAVGRVSAGRRPAGQRHVEPDLQLPSVRGR